MPSLYMRPGYPKYLRRGAFDGGKGPLRSVPKPPFPQASPTAMVEIDLLAVGPGFGAPEGLEIESLRESPGGSRRTGPGACGAPILKLVKSLFP